MKPVRFSIVEALKFSFYTAFEHIFFFLGLLFTWVLSMGLSLMVLGLALLYPMRGAIMALLSQVDQLDKAEFSKALLEIVSKELGIAGSIFILCAFIIGHFFQFGFIRIALDMYDKRSSSLKELFSGWSVLLKGLAVSVLYYLMVCAGLLLFIVPGIIALVTFAFALYIVIDKKCGIIDAFKESARLTKGTRTHVFGLLFILVVIKQLSFSMAGVGYLVVWPVGMLAMAYMYRTLQFTAHHPASSVTRAINDRVV